MRILPADSVGPSYNEIEKGKLGDEVFGYVEDVASGSLRLMRDGSLDLSDRIVRGHSRCDCRWFDRLGAATAGDACWRAGRVFAAGGLERAAGFADDERRNARRGECQQSDDDGERETQHRWILDPIRDFPLNTVPSGLAKRKAETE